jgi:hypothetical protein
MNKLEVYSKCVYKVVSDTSLYFLHLDDTEVDICCFHTCPFNSSFGCNLISLNQCDIEEKTYAVDHDISHDLITKSKQNLLINRRILQCSVNLGTAICSTNNNKI